LAASHLLRNFSLIYTAIWGSPLFWEAPLSCRWWGGSWGKYSNQSWNIIIKNASGK
jgi:hypothetical protein